MGGDHGCGVVIAGAKLALEASKKITALYLVGNQADIHAALPARGFRDHRVRVIHASEVVEMDDKPVIALRKKKDSSIARAAELVSEGKADALVSLGNTGGIFAAATFKVGRIPGVDRGCIATVIPRQSNEFVLLDAGANVECKPLHLAQFAVMGSVYSREILKTQKSARRHLEQRHGGFQRQRTDAGSLQALQKIEFEFHRQRRGTRFVQGSRGRGRVRRFRRQHRFENLESLAVGMFSMLKRELMSNTKRQIGAFLAKNAFHAIRRRMDPELYGGAPLLGFNGMVFKAHGSARERAVTSAIRVTAEAVQHQINQIIAGEIARANETLLRRRRNSSSAAVS